VLFVAFVVFTPFQATPAPDFSTHDTGAPFFTHRVNAMTAGDLPISLDHQAD